MSLSILLSVRACLVTGFHDRAFLEHLNLCGFYVLNPLTPDLWGFLRKVSPHVLLDSLISNWLLSQHFGYSRSFQGHQNPSPVKWNLHSWLRGVEERRHVSRHTEYIQPTVFLPNVSPELSLLLFFLPNDTFLQFIAWATETLQTCAGKKGTVYFSTLPHLPWLRHWAQVGTGGLSFLFP